MIICPKCKTEYEEGYTVCSDCGSKLMEQPKVQEEVIKGKNRFLTAEFITGILIIQFIIGILIILCSTIFSYKLTLEYFVPNGSGQYSADHFLWMLKAYHFSFLLTGIIICSPCILYWFRANKKEH